MADGWFAVDVRQCGRMRFSPKHVWTWCCLARWSRREARRELRRHSWGSPRREASAAPRTCGACRGVSAVPSLVLVVIEIILERWYLAGEQTLVLGIPVDRFE